MQDGTWLAKQAAPAAVAGTTEPPQRAGSSALEPSAPQVEYCGPAIVPSSHIPAPSQSVSVLSHSISAPSGQLQILALPVLSSCKGIVRSHRRCCRACSCECEKLNTAGIEAYTIREGMG